VNSKTATNKGSHFIGKGIWGCTRGDSDCTDRRSSSGGVFYRRGLRLYSSKHQTRSMNYKATLAFPLHLGTSILPQYHSPTPTPLLVLGMCIHLALSYKSRKLEGNHGRTQTFGSLLLERGGVEKSEHFNIWSIPL
jgi:hypothetical protein